MLFSRRYLLFFTAWWLLWSAFHYWLLLQLGIEQEQALADALISNGLLAAFCFGMNFTLRFYRPGGQRVLYLLLWLLADAAACAWLTCEALRQYGHPGPEYVELLQRSLPLRFAVSMLMIGLFLLGGWVRYFLKQQQEVESRRLELEQISRQAELQTLRQQLQPHFLFNTLNSISALAGSRSEEARKMIQQLSDFLRGSLSKEDNQLLPLREELHHLQLYLEIEKVRFGHRLQAGIECAAECGERLLPALLLQPLVENAIKFGLYDTLGEVCIRITATCNARHLHIRVANPFDPETVNPHKGTGFGLASVKRRLYLLFGRHDLLQTTITGNQFEVSLTIPQP